MTRQLDILKEATSSGEADSEVLFAAVLRWDAEQGAWVPGEIEITAAPPLPPYAMAFPGIASDSEERRPRGKKVFSISKALRVTKPTEPECEALKVLLAR